MLGTVTGTETKARETLGKIKAAGYDAVELNGFMIKPTGMMVRLLTKAAGMPTGKGGKFDWITLVNDAGLRVSGIHEDLGSIERDIDAVAKEAHSFGTKNIIITGMYRFDYKNEQEVMKLCSRMNAAGKALREEGISLLYHNHNCEFLKVSSQKTAYQMILEGTNPEYVNFELDSYWPTEAGVNALDLMKQVGSRMKLYHINDRGTRLTGPVMTPILKSDSMELGHGNMNLEALVEQALSVNVEAVILESHKNWQDKSPITSMEVSAEFMNRYVK